MKSSNSPSNTGSAIRPIAGARSALLLLVAINLFNYIDRYVLAAVEPDIRRDLLLTNDPNDPNARAKMGMLATAFLVSYMFTAPVFGRLAERYSRWALIAVGVVLWSLASGASGLAATFAVLLVTRCFVGIGEGAYGPVAPTLLSDFYPAAVRGRILAWFYMAIPVGSALGYALGGHIASLDKANESWRWAFYAVVIPGLILGVWAYLMKEPARGTAEGVTVRAHHARLSDYLILLRTPSYVLNTLGMTAMTFAMGALSWWMPDYLETHRAQAVFGLDPRLFFGVLTAVAGLIATLAGGMTGDLLRPRFSGSYFLVSGIGMAISAPCALLFLYFSTPEFQPQAWIMLFITVFFIFFNTGPTNTILANVTHPSIRATGFAVNILIIHILGDAISPPIVGAIADRWSLVVGFQLVSLFLLIGAAFWLWGTRYLEHDTQAAPHRLAEDV